MPEEGDLVLEFPPDPKATEITDPAVLYTNNGTENTPAVLGNLSVDPKYIELRRRLLRVPDPDADPRARRIPAGRTDDRLRARPEPQRLHVFRRHVGHDARRHPGDDDHRHHRWRQGRTTTTPRPSSTSSNRRGSRTSADPASAQLGGGVEDHQPEQRRASNAHPRQRLSGDGRSTTHTTARPGCNRGAWTTSTFRRRCSTTCTS